MAKNSKKSEQNPSFEEAITQLEQILETMQDENTTLDETIELYARAAALMQQCTSQLHNAELKIEEIGRQMGGAEEPDEL